VSELGKSSGGGSLKYIIGGLLLLLAAVGVFLFSSRKPEGKPAEVAVTPPQPPPAEPERVNPLDTPLILDEPEPPQEPERPKPVPRVSDRDCEDTDLSVDAIKAVISDNSTSMRACYERRLKSNHELQGDVKLKLRVGNAGQIVTAQTSGSLKDNEVLKCVSSKAQHWKFPPPKGGACVLHVPFQFSPKTD